jgi:hypothetical protein
MASFGIWAVVRASVPGEGEDRRTRRRRKKQLSGERSKPAQVAVDAQEIHVAAGHEENHHDS